MRFWDSSAIVPLLVDERATRPVIAEFARDPDMLVWWATDVECVSALARLEREGTLPGSAMTAAMARLDALGLAWHEVQPSGRVRQLSIRLLRTHALRAADAFQLAAALVAGEDQPTTLPFVTLDARLAEAAGREGFRVVNPA